MFDVITIGSAIRDVFLRSSALELHREHGIVEACFVFGAKINVEKILMETGGGATNNAVTFSRLAKLKTAVLTRIGNDSAGRDIIEALKRDRVSTEFVQRAEREHTGYSTIILSGAAERTILTHRGASGRIEAANIPWNRLHAKLFHVSNLNGDLALLKKIIARARRTKAQVFMNPGHAEFKHGRKKLLPLFRQLDVLFVNREEAAELTGQPAANLRKLVKGLRVINELTVLTDGQNGAYAITFNEVLHASIVKVNRINVTGAGDSFCSAFAAAIIKNKDLRTALALGTLNATGVVQKMGAKVGILNRWPSPKELSKVKIKKINI